MNLQSVAPSTGNEIAQAAGAYPGLVQQYQANQAALDAQKFQNASARLAQIQQIFGANPSLAQGPQAMQTVTQLYKQMGVPAPIDPKTGQIDLAAMGAHAPWQTLLSDQATNVYFNSLSTDQKTNYLTEKGVDPSTVPDQILKAAPFQILSPADAYGVSGQVNTDISNLARGIGDINNVQARIKEVSPALDRVFGPGSSAALSANLSANIGPYVQAKIQQAVMTGQLGAAKIPEIQAQINHLNSESDLNQQKIDAQKILNQYLPALTASKIDANESRVASAGAAVTRANAYAAQIGENLKLLQTMGPGSKSWTAMMTSMSSQMKGLGSEIGNLIKQRDALGNVANLSGQNLSDFNSLQAQITSKQAQQTQLQTAAAQMYAKGGVGGGIFSHGIPVNSGTTPDGRPVTKYSDGTILYDDDGTPYSGQ